MRRSSASQTIYACLLLAAVLALMLHLDYIVHSAAVLLKSSMRAPSSTPTMAPPPSPRGAPPPRENGFSGLPLPILLNGLHSLITKPPAGTALSDSQRRRLTVLLTAESEREDRDQRALQACTASIVQTLRPEQKEYIRTHPPLPNRKLSDGGGDPLGGTVLALLKKRAAGAVATPAVPPTQTSEPLENPQGYLEGLLTLEDEVTLRVDAGQAARLLPFLQAQVDVNTHQRRLSADLRKVLNAAQIQCVVEHSDAAEARRQANSETVLQALQGHVEGPDTSLPIPPGQEGGPWLKWPVSFPKLLPGLFMLEQEAPALRLTREQAAQLLPVVDAMGRQWAIVHQVEIKIKQRLSAAQRDWITQRKHGNELTVQIKQLQEAAGPMRDGDNASVRVALQMCDRVLRKDAADAAALAEADKERRRELPDSAYRQGPREEWLTVFDECNGLFFLEKAHPELSLSPAQAVCIRALLDEVVEPLRSVARDEARLRGFLTAAQIDYVQSHMDQVNKYRNGDIVPPGTSGLPQNKDDSNQDPTYHDQLYFETTKFLRSKL